jgi:cell division septum initiation protein DivIVA
MKQPTTVKEAKSMVKERWLDHRVEKLAKENDELREAVDELRVDLDEAHGRSKETLAALSKSSRRPGRMKWLVLAGGAYVLGAKAGRARYEQITGWARSVTQPNGNGTTVDVTDTPKKA